MPTPQKMLFLKMTSDYDAITPHITSIANIYDIKTTVYEYKSPDEFFEFLESAEKFDYMYVAAHGNQDGLAGGTDNFIRWADFAMEICQSPGLGENSVIYLGCCYGGLRRGALILLSNCPTIHHVCGSQCKIDSRDALLAFHTFISHHRNDVESETIKGIVAKSIGKGFDIFSRYNMDVEIAQISSMYFIEPPVLPEHFYPTDDADLVILKNLA